MSGQLAVPEIASIVGMMLGLGVGIDYALFILARHRQNLDDGMPVPEAIGRANATAGLSVLFAGVTVIVAIAGLQVSGIPMMTMMGWASAIMVAITMLAAVTLLPALLGIVGRKVNSAADPVHQAEAGLRPAAPSRPVGRPRSSRSRFAYGVVAAVVLGVLAHPGLLDAPRLRRRGQRRVRRRRPARRTTSSPTRYGPGVNGPFMVVVETPTAPLTPRAGRRPTSARRSPTTKGVASVDEPTVQRGRGPGHRRRHADHRAAGRRRPRSCSSACARTSPGSRR